MAVDDAALGLRMDAWLSKRLDLPRGRIGRALKAGLVVTMKSGEKTVCTKPSTKLKAPWLDALVEFIEPRTEPRRYLPEDLGLASRVIYEDQYLMVVDKPSGMTVHPAKGLVSGTLVNALLHHWGRPAIELLGDEEDDDVDNEDQPSLEAKTSLISRRQDLSHRPGIVHRLDRYTSGVMVVAKDSDVLAQLQGQFFAKTTSRVYHAIVCGCPTADTGIITSRIARDAKNRLRMAIVEGTLLTTLPLHGSAGSTPSPVSAHKSEHQKQQHEQEISARGKGRSKGSKHSGNRKSVKGSSSSSKALVNLSHSSNGTNSKSNSNSGHSKSRGKLAITHWKVLRRYPAAGVAMVEFVLDTGRTHQIRVHSSGTGTEAQAGGGNGMLLSAGAGSTGCPLLSDDVYGGGKGGGTTCAGGKMQHVARQVLDTVRSAMPRQALHARVLGFTHPVSQKRMMFECPYPEDFKNVMTILSQLAVS